MKLRNTVFAMMALSPALASAAALDRSEQQIDALFEKGNYAELSYARVMPKIEGTDLAGTKVKNTSKDYNKVGAAVKFSAGENGNTAFLLKYDQPWGVNTLYTSGILNGTKAEITSDALTAIVGYRTASNFWLYGGLEFQQSEGEVAVVVDRNVTIAGAVGRYNAAVANNTQVPASFKNITPRDYVIIERKVEGGAALTNKEQFILSRVPKTTIDGAANYTLDISKNNTIAGVVGVAYEIPEIALRADVTYRSPAEYDSETLEYGALPSRMKYKFPQSVNLNFQTGVMPKTLLMTKFRWVNWKQFEARPTQYTRTRGNSLASYANDQYSGSIAIGRQLTDKLSAQIGFEYDSGTGKPYTALGPYGDQKGVVVAGKYKINDMIDVAAGVNYTKLGNAQVYSGNTELASFKDSHAIGVGAKLGIHF